MLMCDHCPATSDTALIDVESGLCVDCLDAWRAEFNS